MKPTMLRSLIIYWMGSSGHRPSGSVSKIFEADAEEARQVLWLDLAATPDKAW